MSPRPHSDTARDVDIVQEPEGMEVTRDHVDDSQKVSDADEEVLTMVDQHPRGRREAVGPTPGEPPGKAKQHMERLSPVAGEVLDVDTWELGGRGPRWVEDSGLVGLGLEYSHMRVIPPPSTYYLRPGSRFSGSQQSKRQRYDVEVEIKHVDMRESFLCGYLRIQGLTDDHPTLTTYFEGEVIGTKYGFITEHPSWGATDKIDLSHWSKFTAFRHHSRQFRRGGHVHIKDVTQEENIFMRWKEQFLVPDHRVRMISGASFEGFYYICFNQVRGEVSGIYYHSRSEDFQQLELKHVDNKGCFGAMEFR
ncbi:hypothetical protein VTK26DRAFT_8817 [Humicola hyalothermophila]